jgi:DNA-binding transcriptional ArsR family regulator
MREETLHRLVNYRPRDLDVVFASLSDPTRRAIVARLAREESLSISDLAEPFSITLPAVMKHLDVLGDAGLITHSKQSRTVHVRLSPAPLRGAAEWLRRYERFWSSALDRLAAHAERKETEVRAAEARATRRAR